MSVIFETREPIVFVRLSRPDQLNALSREMLAELARLFEHIQHDSHVRAVILTGEGERAFCAGTDIGELALLDEAGAREASERGQQVCDLIERCRVPVMAAVRGIAAGGGCELALACHLRVAAEDASFSFGGGNGASATSPSGLPASSHARRSVRSRSDKERSFIHGECAPAGGGAANHGGIKPRVTILRIIAAFASICS